MLKYGEKVKFARLKVGMSRMEFAVALGMTEGSIANVERCKDESKKLSYDRMKQIIDLAKLPSGWFFYNLDEIQEYKNNVYARGGTVSDKEADEVSAIAKSLVIDI